MSGFIGDGSGRLHVEEIILMVVGTSGEDNDAVIGDA